MAPARPSPRRQRPVRVGLALVGLTALALLALPVRDALLRSLLYFPMPATGVTPAQAGLAWDDLVFAAEDGVRLHAWWIPAARGAGAPTAAHVLLCHGNAGPVDYRLLHARLLHDAGLDVLLFDYRGYGRSAGTPSEDGTYRDARAARTALLARDGVEPGRVVYLGESLGGAVALELALTHPPLGLVLQSTFTSVRGMARLHYPFIPQAVVPDAYPSLRRIPDLRAPLLVLHGDADDIVPLSEGEALFAAAREPKRLHVFPGLGHNDLIDGAGEAWARVIADWVSGL